MFAGHRPSKMSLHRQRRNIMYIERLVRNLVFAIAAVAIVIGLSATIEYQPVLNALAKA